MVRDADTDRLRNVGKNVWGVGGEEGANLVRTSFDNCITELDKANRESAAWTGNASNAYADQVNKTNAAMNGISWEPR